MTRAPSHADVGEQLQPHRVPEAEDPTVGVQVRSSVTMASHWSAVGDDPLKSGALATCVRKTSIFGSGSAREPFHQHDVGAVEVPPGERHRVLSSGDRSKSTRVSGEAISDPLGPSLVEVPLAVGAGACPRRPGGWRA